MNCNTLTKEEVIEYNYYQGKEGVRGEWGEGGKKGGRKKGGGRKEEERTTYRPYITKDRLELV